MKQRGDKSLDSKFTIANVKKFVDLPRRVLNDLVSTYQASFSGEPYLEDWEPTGVERCLAGFLEKGGHLLVGEYEGRAIGLAGGYPREDAYYIDELAVSPEYQGRGFGKQLLRALLVTANTIANGRFEIRTSVANERALHMYEAEGFTRQPVLEVVPHKRVDGTIRLDKRVTLSRPEATEDKLASSLHRVVVAYPSGNTTALVFDDCLDRDRQVLNSALMNSWKRQASEEPEIEQCGFVTQPVNAGSVARLEMMGGEFCGNAFRCAAWLVTEGEPFSGSMEVSGVNRPLAFNVTDDTVSVEMPVPIDHNDLVEAMPQGTIVRLEGISHFVVDGATLDATPRALLGRILSGNVGGLAMSPAAGVTSFDASTGEAKFAVWVGAVNTIFDETACGSGTSAIAIAMAIEGGESIDVPVRQPSGEIIWSKAVMEDGRLVSSWISGPVRVIYDGGFNLNVG